MDQLDCVVIGAGVVGLAIARALAQRKREVFVLEAADAIGTGISSRNSEVVHAGLYYPPGSLKATLCRDGNARLRAYCEARQIGFSPVGKLVIAVSPAQVPKLEAIHANARACGVTTLEWLDAAGVHAREPALQATAGLYSPTSAIVDSHALMTSLQADAEASGATFVFQSPLLGGRVSAEDPVLTIGGTHPIDVTAPTVVNCAGLNAQVVARALEGLDQASIPEEAFAKGSYFSLTGASPFRHLVYPVPEPGGLGIHLTLDRAGRARFGPDVEWVAAPDYTVDAARAGHFQDAIRRYWPGLPDDALAPDYAGVRPKLKRAGTGFSDFLLVDPSQHHVRGLFNLFAIESPGLTSALALADLVAAAVARCA